MSTYGKTWHTWQVDRDPTLPTGIPQLMMGFTAEGQVRPELVEARDAALGISTVEVKADRVDLARSAPHPDPAADGWKDGTAHQLALGEVPVRNRR